MTDKEIIIKIKRGEIDYYSYIVNKYTASIYRYIKVKIKNKEDVEDLVQNVFVSFYKAIERFDENKSVKPYLYKIAINELKIFYRKYRRLIPLKEDLIVEEKNSDFVETIMDKKQIINNQHLKKLSQQEKEIILMIGDGYRYEEVSKKFKKPLNTIKSIIRRARLKVRREYEKT